jgi:hypothetical protein
MDVAQQLAFRGMGLPAPRKPLTVEARRQADRSARRDAERNRVTLCAGCRAKEARYGFRPEGEDATELDRPRALCFDCFRMELDHRREVNRRLARGWNASQVGLPLEETLNRLSLRRRRAQIAARHALELS